MSFLTPLRLELVDPLANDGQGDWELIGPLEYEDVDGVLWTVPSGYRTDLASVGRWPVAFVLTGNSNHGPAALHDWAISTNACPREKADAIFLEAMESLIPEDHPDRDKLRTRAGRMYRAVAAHTRNLAKRRNPWGTED